jgi:hypothetical protein
MRKYFVVQEEGGIVKDRDGRTGNVVVMRWREGVIVASVGSKRLL